MKWLLKRLSLVCLMMGVLCSVAVAVGRLDHAPDKLQILVINLCGSEPCFKGIKVGADWATMQKIFSTSTVENGALEIDNLSDVANLFLLPTTDNSTVDAIQIRTKTDGTPLPFDARDVILQFGDPCSITID